MCEKIHFFMVKVSFVGIVMFPLLTTALNYFVGDLKEDSYLLPTPATYVSGCRSCSNCTSYLCVFDSFLEGYHSTGVCRLDICWQWSPKVRAFCIRCTQWQRSYVIWLHHVDRLSHFSKIFKTMCHYWMFAKRRTMTINVFVTLYSFIRMWKSWARFCPI